MKPVIIIAIAFVLLIPTTVFAQPTDRCANLNPGALLMNCDLHGMDLSKKDLSGANLSGADLTNTDLTGVNLRYANLSGANLSGAILTNTDLSFANLSGAILTNTDLSYANLSGANLSGANLSGANIYSTNFAGVDIDDIIGLEDAVYNENSMENNKNDYTKNSDESQTNSLAKVKCGIGTMLKDGQCIVDTNYKTPEPTSEGGGCLIATATYGSELAPEVQKLRELRDNHLLNTESGTAFMGTFNDIYYSFSPIIADYERENPVFREMVKMAITPMISSLSILNYVDMNSEAEVLGYGISLILLNLGMYLGVPAIVIIGIRKKF